MARELKYSSPNTDLTALQRELAGPSSTYTAPSAAKDDDDESEDVEYADRWSDDGPGEDWVGSR